MILLFKKISWPQFVFDAEYYIPFSGVRLYVFILYNLFYINHEL